MPLKTIIFLVSFVCTCGGTLFVPLIGVAGYIVIYHLAPQGSWWGQDISHWGIRYFFVLAAFLAVGLVVNWRKLRYGRTLLNRHEVLLLAFVALIWLSTLWGEAMSQGGMASDYPPVKVAKIVLFCLMMTHVVTSNKSLRVVFWTLAFGAAVLGYQAYFAEPGMFRTGRLNSIGGPDFREANALAGHFAALLPIIAVLFLRAKWKFKPLALVAGVLAANGLILTRSRGGFLALVAAGLAGLWWAPKGYRKIVVAGLIVAGIGTYALMDPGFLNRTSTITAGEEQRDVAAQSRLVIWRASVDMLRDHPMGVGAGNFLSAIGRYNPTYKGADAHNSFVRCYGELGVAGGILYVLLIGNSLWVLRRVQKEALRLPGKEGQDLAWSSYAVAVGVCAFAVSGFTNTNLYLEGPWWFLAAAPCLQRALENIRQDSPKGNDAASRHAGPADVEHALARGR